jgi:hypothetical protein
MPYMVKKKDIKSILNLLFALSVFLCTFILLLSPFWAYDKIGTKKLLEQQGYTAIEIKGYNWFACSEGDIFSTGFKATNANNNIVEGTACRGLFKNTTIRFN